MCLSELAWGTWCSSLHVFAFRLCVCLHGLMCAKLASVTQHEDVVESKGGDVTVPEFECVKVFAFVC